MLSYEEMNRSISVKEESVKFEEYLNKCILGNALKELQQYKGFPAPNPTLK